MDRITAIGIMSGTSVDGLDIIAAEFSHDNGRWEYRIMKSRSEAYPDPLRQRLVDCIRFTGEELVLLDHQLGEYIGENVKNFCAAEKVLPDIIACHGHTVFHQPEKGITCQIGDGQTIFQKTGIRVINDFRKIDVLRGGQGAPLVPVGDKLLFGEYQFCLNLGGFSNISFDNADDDRKAYDIGPANIILNYLSRLVGREFDDRGMMARKGNLINILCEELNSLSYYSMPAPKSLGLEWAQKNIIQRISGEKLPIEDLMRTFVEHIAFQINAAIKREKELYFKAMKNNVLVTGGGAYNDFLMERLHDLADGFEYVLPGRETIDFKEALIFAFLGVLRYRNSINIWKSVTGAKQDSSGGTIHYHK
ncbi:MAG: anhydro-N-acetylmuramic acid kinase [Cyclobacteriaceae bacterium]|nr:anhydro-N-acetylmuramic acid kinase [Cyclobacteriaceae bacterium]